MITISNTSNVTAPAGAAGRGEGRKSKSRILLDGLTSTNPRFPWKPSTPGSISG
jgi:hypothetical protein